MSVISTDFSPPFPKDAVLPKSLVREYKALLRRFNAAYKGYAFRNDVSMFYRTIKFLDLHDEDEWEFDLSECTVDELVYFCHDFLSRKRQETTFVETYGGFVDRMTDDLCISGYDEEPRKNKEVITRAIIHALSRHGNQKSNLWAISNSHLEALYDSKTDEEKYFILDHYRQWTRTLKGDEEPILDVSLEGFLLQRPALIGVKTREELLSLMATRGVDAEEHVRKRQRTDENDRLEQRTSQTAYSAQDFSERALTGTGFATPGPSSTTLDSAGPNHPRSHTLLIPSGEGASSLPGGCERNGSGGTGELRSASQHTLSAEKMDTLCERLSVFVDAHTWLILDSDVGLKMRNLRVMCRGGDAAGFSSAFDEAKTSLLGKVRKFNGELEQVLSM